MRPGLPISAHKSFRTRTQRRIRNLRRWVYAVLARGLVFLLERLPFRLLRAVIRLLALPVMHLQFSRLAEQNLIVAFGDRIDPDERRRLIRRMLRSLADIPAEVLAARRRGPDFLRERFTGDAGLAKWRALQEAQPIGVIGLTGHIGNWELLLQWLHLHGVRPVGGAVAKRIPNPRLNRIVEEVRGCFGVPTLYGDVGVMQLARVLASGKTLGLVPDQDITDVGGVFVEFFGRPAYTPSGPARLALATGAPIVPAFARRDGERLELVVGEPIHPDRRAPRDAEVLRLTRAWNDQLESFLREHPDQWPWFHDRWYTTPERLAARRRG